MKKRDEIVATFLAFSLIGCASTAPGSLLPGTSAGTPTRGSGPPAATASAGTDSPAPPPDTGQPAPSDGAPSTPRPEVTALPGSIEPLPDPTLTEPSAIGEALTDPARVPDAVVSLLDVMRIGIYANDGQVIRAGDERDEDDLSVSETEVRNFIQHGVADAKAASTDGHFAFSFSDLGAALQPLLEDWPTERLAATYNQDYSDHPDGIAAQVMLGQPIEPTTPLSRVHIWLLYVDGFVDAPALPAAALAGANLAQVGSRWGAVNVALPAPQLPGWATSWASLFAAHAILGLDLELNVTQTAGGGHEGHGQNGPSVTLIARVVAGMTTSGRRQFPWGGPAILGRANPLPVNITWQADDPQFLSRHGTLGSPLGVPMPFSPHVGTSLRYQIRQEPANGQGRVVLHGSDMDTYVNTNELVQAIYEIPPEFNGFFLGMTRGSYARLYVEWHQESFQWDVNISWTNSYNGVPDTMTFVGVVDTLDPNSPDDVFLMMGTGTVSGDRGGWKACNPGIDELPFGTVPAQFHAVVGEETISVSAFAEPFTALSGISTANFDVDIDGGTDDFPRTQTAGELCPHFSYGNATVTPFE